MIPTPVPAHVFVSAQNTNAITGYPTGATGNRAPVTTITGSNTGLGAPVGMDIDASGNIYVANLFTVTVYPPNPIGTLNEAPTATIMVNNGGVTLYGMGVDASGTHVEHQGIGGAMLGADRPPPLIGRKLGISPRPDLLALRPLDAR